jgi:hypothetical protein
MPEFEAFPDHDGLDLRLWKVEPLTCGDSLWRSPFVQVREFWEHPAAAR